MVKPKAIGFATDSLKSFGAQPWFSPPIPQQHGKNPRKEDGAGRKMLDGCWMRLQHVYIFMLSSRRYHGKNASWSTALGSRMLDISRHMNSSLNSIECQVFKSSHSSVASLNGRPWQHFKASCIFHAGQQDSSLEEGKVEARLVIKFGKSIDSWFGIR